MTPSATPDLQLSGFLALCHCLAGLAQKDLDHSPKQLLVKHAACSSFLRSRVTYEVCSHSRGCSSPNLNQDQIHMQQQATLSPALADTAFNISAIAHEERLSLFKGAIANERLALM